MVYVFLFMTFVVTTPLCLIIDTLYFTFIWKQVVGPIITSDNR